MPRLPALSNRAQALKPSLTLEISARAKELRQQGQDICSLSAGEPDFDTPKFIVEAAQRALADGLTRYGPAAGDPELRAAVAEKLTLENRIPTKASEVLITNGGKQAIYNLFQVLLNPGDEVLIPAPYWLSYPEMARLAGASVKVIPSQADEGFRLDVEALERIVRPQSRLLIINTPGNPTGRVMQRDELKAVVDLLSRHPQLLVMSDEIYEFLLADGQTHISFASLAEELRSRCFTVNGFAKGWAMTGWRLGYLAGDEQVIKAARFRVRAPAMSAALPTRSPGGLERIPGLCAGHGSQLQPPPPHAREGLREIEGIVLDDPTGAFYAFPQLPTSINDSMDFCRRALEEQGLAVVPGAAFGDDRCIRLSCAVSRETIGDGLQRLGTMLNRF